MNRRLDTLLDTLVSALAGQTGSDGTLNDPDQETATPPDHYAQVGTALALCLRNPADKLSRQCLDAWLALPTGQRGHAPFNRFLLLLLNETITTADAGAIDTAMITAGLSCCPLAGSYPSNNWTLLAQLCRLMEARTKKAHMRATQGLEFMLERWTTPAGGFIDFPAHPGKTGGATPMAYHHKALFVATVALRYTDSAKLTSHVQRLLDWVLLTWDGHAHVGGFGRSTHSLFGDACLLASLLLLDLDQQADKDSTGSRIVEGILERWLAQSRNDSLLALNPSGNQSGWDSYMFLSVYNAWAAAIVGWAQRVTTYGNHPVVDAGSLDHVAPAFKQDNDAGLLRTTTAADLVALVATRGQMPQAFSRDEVELRYAGGVPFHVIHNGRILCPPGVRLRSNALLERPALAGWTPVFLIDGLLFGLTEYTTAQVEETSSRYRITLEGSPLALLRPPASTAWQRCKAAIDWRLLDGALGRREVFRRKRADQVRARLVVSLSRQQPELTHELVIHRTQPGAVRYLNPGGHALVADALPRTRELETGFSNKGRAAGDPGLGVEGLREMKLDSAIPGATGYCLAGQPIGAQGYSHRLVLKW